MELLDAEIFNKIKTRVFKIVGDQQNVKNMFKSMADMYWISETDVGAGNSNMNIRYNSDAWAEDDIRLTASTNSRDQVTGLHRLLRTSKPKFNVTCRDKSYADKIEKALLAWWEASNERMRVKNESELTLSGILWSDIHLAVTSVDDLVTTLDNAMSAGREDTAVLRVQKKRLEKLRKKTPFLFEAESALEVYTTWDKGIGKSEHLTMSTIKGRALRERWGVMDVVDEVNYNLYDYWNLAYRCVGYGQGTLDTQIMGGLHELPDIPRFSAVADGTDLFPEEMKKRNPFLYGKWKSNIHKREDELMTILASSTFARGAGPLILRDKSDPHYQGDDIESDFQGLVRVMAMSGKPQFVDDHAYDSNLLQLQGLYSGMGESTTISGQTLGAPIEKYTAYSGYVAAQRGGRLPVLDLEDAEKKVIHDAAMYALEYFKDSSMEWEGLKPTDILDDVEIEVKLDVDLPIDAVQTAQALAQLNGLDVPISNEWVHEKLQIRDSRKMVDDWMSERATMASFQQDLPNLVQQTMALLQAIKNPPEAPPGEIPGQVPQGVPSGVPPEAPINNAQPGVPGGPEAALAGGAVPPATQPIPAENIRGPQNARQQ